MRGFSGVITGIIKSFFESLNGYSCPITYPVHHHFCTGFLEVTVIGTEHSFTLSFLELRLVKQFRSQSLLIFLGIGFAEQSKKDEKASRVLEEVAIN